MLTGVQCNGAAACVDRCTMKQLGLSLNEDDVHAMMRSVGIGPHGKISYPGIVCIDYIDINDRCAHLVYDVTPVIV